MPYRDPAKRKAYQREYQKRWYAANRESRKVQIAKWRDRNRERLRIYNLEYKHEHIDEMRLRDRNYSRRWRVANKDRKSESDRLWRRNNKAALRAYYLKYRALYKDKRRIYMHAYWARRIPPNVWSRIIAATPKERRNGQRQG